MRRIPLAATLCAVVLAGCVPASPDADTYRDKAALTLGSAVSDVRTVSSLLDTLYDGRMLRPTAVAQLRYSEEALDTATDAFTELNPPPSQQRLYTRASSLLGDAGDLTARARITVERKQVDRYPAVVEDLEALARRIERLEGQVS